MLNKKQLKKLEEIRSHEDCKARCMIELCAALKDGVAFDDLPTLTTRVEDAYKTGKHIAPGAILKKFKLCIDFLYKELVTNF